MVVAISLLSTVPASAEEDRSDYVQCLEDVVTIKNNQIDSYQKQISGLTAIADAAHSDNRKLHAQIESLERDFHSQIGFLERRLVIAERRIAAANNLVDSFANSNGIGINPTYRQMKDFILFDKISKRAYVIYDFAGDYLNNYVCWNYAADVNNNADKVGIRCSYTMVIFNDGLSHAIVAFETTDRGIIYISPQTDCEIPLEVGYKNWEAVVHHWNNIW